MSLLYTFLVILIIIFLGYFSKRIGLLEVNNVDTLNKIVINIAMPCLVFYSLYNTDIALIPKLGILPIANIVIAGICGLIAFVILSIKKYDIKKKWSIVLVAAMANTGFFGYPLILGVFGNDGLIRAIFYDVGTTLLFIIFNLLLLILFGGKLKNVVKKILSFPLLWAVVLGLLFNVLNIPIGPVVSNVLVYLKALTVPLIMLSLGLSIDFRGLTKSLDMAAFTSVIKLVIAPIIAVFVLKLFGVSGFEYQISVIEAAMPPAMLALALAINYDLDFHVASDCIFVDMMVSLITLPIIMSIV